MKNLILAFLLLAGTAVMAQTGAMKAEAFKMETTAEASTLTALEEIQKSIDITADQAEKVMAIQKKYCGPDAKASSDVNDKEFHAALTQVITAEQADKFMKECKASCAPQKAKAEAGTRVETKSKSCCSSASTASKKSCSKKK